MDAVRLARSDRSRRHDPRADYYARVRVVRSAMRTPAPTTRQFHRGLDNVLDRHEALHVQPIQDGREPLDDTAMFATCGWLRFIIEAEQFGQVALQSRRDPSRHVDTGPVYAPLDVANG